MLFYWSVICVFLATLMPVDGKIAGNYLDKVVHFILFTFMTYRALLYFFKKVDTTEVVVTCILVGFLTEFLQQFIPGRNMDFYDALADTLGVVASYYYSKRTKYRLERAKI